MAGPGLPVNIDTTYADSGTDASVKAHQQHHDLAHAYVNKLDTTALTGVNGQYLAYGASNTLVPVAAPSGSPAFAVLPAPNGTDDTTAIQAVLNGGSSLVYARPAAYKITALTVPTGVSVIGSTPKTYLGTPASGTVFTVISGSAPAFTMSGSASIDTLGIVGNQGGPCVYFTSTAICNTVRNCVITGGTVGIEFNYRSVNLVVGCIINTNTSDGISTPVDSMIRDCYINGNSGSGIYLPSGSSDNTISGNKLEWNAGRGLNAYQASNNVITNNVIDRNTDAGISLSGCDSTSITGNVLRRNGAGQSGQSGTEDCQIHVENSTGTSITGNVTSTGANDDSTGYVSPRYAIYVSANPGTLRIVGNDLKGFTSQAFFWDGSNADIAVGFNGTGSVEAASGIRTLLGSLNTGNVNAATPATLTFAALAMGTYSGGYSYTLDLLARDTITATRSFARVYVVVSREAGNATVSALVFTNIIGTSFGSSATTYTVAATAPSPNDGSKLAVTITNNSTHVVSFSANLT